MKKGEVTRQRIIAQAAPLFNQRGYSGCSLNDIMEVTGLEKGGIYRHFESKEELAAEAFDFAWAAVLDHRTRELSSIADPLDRLKQHIASFGSGTIIPGGCPLLNTAIDSDDGNPVLRERVRKALHEWRAMLRKIIEEGIAQGVIRPGLDPANVANHLIASLEGGMVISRIEHSDTALRNARSHLETYLETEVRNPPGKHSSRNPHPNRN